MTTLGVLAGIVVPAVSGTKEASNEGEVRGKARLYCAGRGQRLFRRPELGWGL